MKVGHLFTAVAAAALLAVPTAQAQYTSSLGGTGYSCYNSASPDCFAASGGNYIWHGGDFWEQAVTGTGLASVSSLSWSFTTRDYANQPLNFSVFVNSTLAGSWAMPVGTGNPSGSSIAFAPIGAASVDDYTIRWQIDAPGACSGCGAVQLTSLQGSAFTIDGRAVVVTPEPASLMLLGTGLVGIAGFAHRRRQSA